MRHYRDGRSPTRIDRTDAASSPRDPRGRSQGPRHHRCETHTPCQPRPPASLRRHASHCGCAHPAALKLMTSGPVLLSRVSLRWCSPAGNRGPARPDARPYDGAQRLRPRVSATPPSPVSGTVPGTGMRHAKTQGSSDSLTAPQRRALRAIAADQMRWAPGERRYWSTEPPPTTRHDVAERVVAAGYAEIGAVVSRTQTSRRVVLTSRGRREVSRQTAPSTLPG